jgi:hypothetical protein
MDQGRLGWKIMKVVWELEKCECACLRKNTGKK